ncbi:MAG: beta-ketoacyl-[acyl-carrier-protein] synthase family protein [Bifidobacteriaceae bacterium]|jgi:3-oxoacyl-[acyl-carrier-protein] synthase II|nr:beta-ketoacyl-[acyl-carrier-protein] synthase family protein [Bifidobacteriaceae bacterium]
MGGLPDPARSVVVTGLGATTPLGGDVPSTWRALLAGVSGVSRLDNTWAEDYGLSTDFAGVLAVPAADVLTRQECRRADPSAQYALIAARQAWADAGFSAPPAGGGTPSVPLGDAVRAASPGSLGTASTIGQLSAGGPPDDTAPAPGGGAATTGDGVAAAGDGAGRPGTASSPGPDPERFAVVMATGIGGIQTMLSAWDTVRERGARRLLPLTVPMLMPNSPSAVVAIDLGARGGAHAPVSACASGAEALVQGARLIRDGLAEVVVAGGAEAAVHPLTLGAFGKMRALSTRRDSPETASRPYCVTRDGFVMGEGAGAVVLESAAHAAARGARVYARLAGVGSSSDAYDVAPPDPSGQGQLRAMRQALAEAGPAAATVAHVNAHATATPAGDGIEAAAIVEALAQALGSRAAALRVPVSATKSMTGHLLGAAGAVESIFAILALRDRLAPPTINIQQLDPSVECLVTREIPVPLPPGPISTLNNAFGFGGHNMALLFTTP